MRSEDWQHIVNGRQTHYDVDGFQVHTTEDSGKKIDTKASQRKMQTANNYEKQRYNMNQLKHTNLTLSEGVCPHLLYSKNRRKNPLES